MTPDSVKNRALILRFSAPRLFIKPISFCLLITEAVMVVLTPMAVANKATIVTRNIISSVFFRTLISAVVSCFTVLAST